MSAPTPRSQPKLCGAVGMNLSVEIPADVLEQIAERAAELLAERQAASASPWLSTQGAADYIAAPAGRIHDLVALRKLTPRRDGRRLLFRREELDAYLENGR
jgi:excisionase family DNA binding protein